MHRAALLGGLLLSCVGKPPVPCTQCGDLCVDLTTDPANCGNCGNTCNSMQLCTNGSCHDVDCPASETRCGDSCVDPQTDVANCGGCGRTCNVGQVCQTGNCVASCAAPLTLCEMACIDPDHDPKNCGGCGVQCAPDHVVAAACVNMSCSYSQCAPNYADCDGLLQNGCETETDFDLYNCGGCGVFCLPAHVTSRLSDGGVFVDPDAGEPCNPADAGDAGCPLPQPPRGALCATGRCAYQACAPGWADCDGVTLNGCETPVLEDVNNCGGCFVQCGAAQSCDGGSCE